MAGIETRLQTIRRAILAFRETPGRTGRLVQLHDCDEILVAGDMHGHIENFRRLLGRADLAAHPRRHLVVQELIHGPFLYPTGGDKSHQLVDLLCALKAQFPRQVHYLLGNHELAQLTGRSISKNDQDLNDLFEQGVLDCYGTRGAELYGLYLVLFRLIPIALKTANRTLISHSLPSAGTMLEFDPAALLREPTADSDVAPGGSLYALVWGRDVREETLSAFLRKMDADRLISGHIPCESGFERPSTAHVILDSQGSPSAYLLLPAERPITPEEWTESVGMLS
jgi:hypothetical protein